MPVTNPKQRATRPLDRFADQIAEVIAVSKRRAFILDLTGRLRYAEDGEECPSPIDITMPGMPLIVADPEVHRRLDAVEAAHTAAVHPAISAVAKQHGPAAERAMFWKGAGAAYHDFTRHGPVVLWRYGMNNAFNEKRRICRGVDEQAAIAFLADIRSKPPAGYRATSPSTSSAAAASSAPTRRPAHVSSAASSAAPGAASAARSSSDSPARPGPWPPMKSTNINASPLAGP